MILIERLNAQIQVGNTSHAIVSSRPKNTNPMISVYEDGGLFIWDFTGLQIGEQEIVTGKPRRNHFDFYIGMDDLLACRKYFPKPTAKSLGLAADGLRIPVGKVRPGGKAIAWRGPLARLEFNKLTFFLPPYKVVTEKKEPCIINIDKEFSRYPIDNGHGQTTREIHFGFENTFKIQSNKSVKNPQIWVEMSPEQYATCLEAIDLALKLHKGV